MAIVIQPYREEHQAAMQEFNRRLQAAGAGPDLVFYRSSQPHWLPKVEGGSIYNEYFIAVDGTAVRGAYALKHEKILAGGCDLHSVACYHHPLSEGVVSRSYAAVGGLMLRDALARQPKLYALGMGGLDRPLPKMLAALGWSFYLIPFYFKVVHPYRFLREMAPRRSTGRRLLMDLGATTGIGWAAIKMSHAVIKWRASRPGPFMIDEINDFDAWVDPLWFGARDECAMATIRDSATLRRLYPLADRHFTRLRINRNGAAIGWAVVGERRQDAKFGSMHVGSIIDCWAMPGDKLPVIHAASEVLEAQGMDLIVCNHGHQLWHQAFRSAGFLNGPSNFIFAAAKGLSELLQPYELAKKHIGDMGQVLESSSDHPDLPKRRMSEHSALINS
jgi:hypothetical protein